MRTLILTVAMCSVALMACGNKKKTEKKSEGDQTMAPAMKAGDMDTKAPAKAMDAPAKRAGAKTCAKKADCGDGQFCFDKKCFTAATLATYCAAHKNCKTQGWCGVQKGRCGATTADHCKNSASCKSSGRCGFRTRAGHTECVVSAEGCKATASCKKFGSCTPSKSLMFCEAGSDADCKQSEYCKKSKLCKKVGSSCRK